MLHEREVVVAMLLCSLQVTLALIVCRVSEIPPSVRIALKSKQKRNNAGYVCKSLERQKLAESVLGFDWQTADVHVTGRECLIDTEHDDRGVELINAHSPSRDLCPPPPVPSKAVQYLIAWSVQLHS